MTSTFVAGCHPADNKYLAKDKSIEEFPIPEKVIIPVSQHIGTPAKVVVEINNNVNVGQLIASANGFISANIHSSVSGKIKKIGRYPHPSLGYGKAIEIEVDKEKTLEDEKKLKQKFDLENHSPVQLLNTIKKAGIVGLGGAAFPTNVKLSPPPDKTIDTLILNGVECEPYLTADYRLMLEHSDKIILGAQILSRILNVDDVYIGIEDNKIDIYNLFLEKYNDNGFLQPVLLETKYPQGAEKQLIDSVTRRQVPPNSLPMDIGIVVQNVGTCAAVAEACRNIPLYKRILTVTGQGINETKNLKVRIGTLFSDIIEFCGGLNDNAKKVINGGPMMGIAQFSTDVPVLKGTSGILALTREEIEKEKEFPCIRCGKCHEVCPMYLMPAEFYRYSKSEDIEQLNNLFIIDCMECGSCAFTCPASIPLVQYIKKYKRKVLNYLRNK